MKNSRTQTFNIALTIMLAAGVTPAFATDTLARVPGFLVPTTQVIPPDYREFIHVIKKDHYAFQFDHWQTLDQSNYKPVKLGNGVTGIEGTAAHGQLRDAQLFLNEHQEDEDVSYDRDKHSLEESKYSTKIKDFTLNGCDGVIFETAGFPGQKENVMYELLYKDGNRLLKITRAFEKRDPAFSSDSLIEMLQKFKRIK